MRQYQEIVAKALKDKSPSLHKALSASGELDEFVTERASEISSAINQAMQEARTTQGWDKLNPIEMERRLNAAKAMYEEQVLADLLEFPTDDA